MSCRRLTAATTMKYELETLKFVLRIKKLKITKKYPVLHFLSFFFFYFSLSCVNLFVKLSAFQHELEYSSGKCRRVILSHTSLTYEDVPAIHRHLCRIDDIRHSIYERDQSSVYKVKTVSNSIFFYKLPLIFFTDTR